MQTTEIFIEQVLIGAMVLLIGALPFYDDWGGQVFAGGEKSPLLLYAVVFVAAAYLLGIPFDRFIDARMTHYEKHIRARHGLQLQQESEREREAERMAQGKTEILLLQADPFPEDRLRIQMHCAAQTVGDLFNYERSTIRLSRALAVCTPGLAVAAIVAASGHPACLTGRSTIVLLAACHFLPPAVGKLLVWARPVDKNPAANPASNTVPQGNDNLRKRVLAFICNLLKPVLALIDYLLKPILAFIEKHSAPRTNELGKLETYWTNRDSKVNTKTLRWVTLRDISCASVTWTHAALMLISLELARQSPQPVVLGLAAAGISLTLLSGWAWWRITTTFMTYLDLLDRFGGSKTKHGAVAAADGS